MIRHVAIVGAGFSGTLLAVNLLRHDGPAATLIERGSAAGQGVAYGTARPDHLLNVRAANMSAFPDQPDHFVRWLDASGTGATGGDFVPRRVYGCYLRALLTAAQAAAPDRLTLIDGEAVDIDGAGVTLRDGRTIAADAAVMAVGNLAPQVPPEMARIADAPCYIGNPWNPSATDGLGNGDSVLLIGTGLTMVNVALTLQARGFAGRMIALSRRGLLPHRHAAAPPADDRTSAPAAVDAGPRGAGAGGGVRVAQRGRRVAAVHAGDMGSGRRDRAPPVLAPSAAVVGHPSPPAGAAGRRSYRRSGRERPVEDTGRQELRSCRGPAWCDGRLATARQRRSTGAAGDAGHIVHRAAGDLTRTDDPLLARLYAAGHIRPDAEHLGIEVGTGGQILRRDGTIDDRLFAIGPMTRGAYWEIVAVPDIRRQVWDVARYLSNAHWVGGEGL